ncbi:MAG: hypothetical protein V7642_1541 [Burkholderiales bacterium]
MAWNCGSEMLKGAATTENAGPAAYQTSPSNNNTSTGSPACTLPCS